MGSTRKLLWSLLARCYYVVYELYVNMVVYAQFAIGSRASCSVVYEQGVNIFGVNIRLRASGVNNNICTSEIC